MRFFMIDRITRWEVGTAAAATKNVALSEDFFDDHFPRRPVMPGVLIVEGMAQLAGLLLEASLREKSGQSVKAVLTILERTKFRDMVRPGDTLLYTAEVTSLNDSAGKAHVQASRDGRTIAETDMVFAFKIVDDPKLDEKRQALMKVWLDGEQESGTQSST
jgi:3-hydroxyacyl-[acyl-carrier-protein] dehydratase